MLLLIVSSLLTGASAGIMYGLSLQSMEREARSVTSQSFIRMLIHSAIVRMSLFGLVFFLLLRAALIQPILFLATFFIGMWLTLLKQKV